MDYLFKRIETGQYVAYSTLFRSPDSIMYNLTSSALFKTEEDAIFYGRCVYKWWQSLFPSCLIPGILDIYVRSELVTFDGNIIHSMSGLRWDLSRIEESTRIFETWKKDIKDQPTLEECETLAKSMRLPYAHEKRNRCCPKLRNRSCVLDIFLCLFPKSI